MTYKDIRHIITRIYLHPKQLIGFIGQEKFNYISQFDNTPNKYHVYCVLGYDNKYHNVLSNFRNGFEMFEIPYFSPNQNKYLPILE